MEGAAAIPSSEERIKAALVIKRANISRFFIPLFFLAVVLYRCVLFVANTASRVRGRYKKDAEPKEGR